MLIYLYLLFNYLPQSAQISQNKKFREGSKQLWQVKQVLEVPLHTFHTGGLGSCGPRHLARQAGALYGLRSLLDLVPVAAAVGDYYLTGPWPHLRQS